MQEAEEQLDAGKAGFVEASALTHKQVLEMAVAEASRRVLEATKYASHLTPFICCAPVLPTRVYHLQPPSMPHTGPLLICYLHPYSPHVFITWRHQPCLTLLAYF